MDVGLQMFWELIVMYYGCIIILFSFNSKNIHILPNIYDGLRMESTIAKKEIVKE